MTDFLTLNGIPISVLAEGFDLGEPLEVGDRDRAYDGTLLVSRQTTKEVWAGKAKHQSAADALAFRKLVLGLGHHASWDSHLYTSKGLPPNPTTGLSIVTATPKVGAGNLQAAANNPVRYASYAAGLGSDWTVMVWRRVAAGAWASYVVTSGGHKWLDGARSDGTSTTWLSVTSGTVRLDGDLASTVDYDDGVFLPYVIPDAWGPYYHSETAAGRAFSDLPALRAGGDVVRAAAATATVVGKVGRSEVVAAALAGVWATNIHVVEFTLEEQ